MVLKSVAIPTIFKSLPFFSKIFQSSVPMNEMTNKKPIVWVDMEMTGLDLKKDRIMEIACIITDSQLNVIAEGPNVIVHQPDSLLLNMDSWCTKTHTKTGLLNACQRSSFSEKEAEDMILSFIQLHTKRNEAPLAGNTIYMDRLFLREQMPRIDNWLHYRIIDVTSIKELCHRWNHEIYKNR